MRFIWLLVLLASCSIPALESKHEYVSVPMNDSINDETSSEILIAPYRDGLQQTMETVLAQNETPLIRGLPECTLGNLIADLLLERAQLEMPGTGSPDFCLINIGGLRVDLPEGEITTGKVFELMPFENELDIIKLSPEKMRELLDYLHRKGGQPISGMRLTISKDGFSVSVNDKPLDSNRSYYVVTSDYLADGGDNMNFFKEPLERIHTGIKIRDAIIDHFRILGLANKPITSAIDGRLIIE